MLIWLQAVGTVFVFDDPVVSKDRLKEHWKLGILGFLFQKIKVIWLARVLVLKGKLYLHNSDHFVCGDFSLRFLSREQGSQHVLWANWMAMCVAGW